MEELNPGRLCRVRFSGAARIYSVSNRRALGLHGLAGLGGRRIQAKDHRRVSERILALQAPRSARQRPARAAWRHQLWQGIGGKPYCQEGRTVAQLRRCRMGFHVDDRVLGFSRVRSTRDFFDVSQGLVGYGALGH